MGRGLPPVTLTLLLAITLAFVLYLIQPAEARRWIDYDLAIYPFRYTEPGPYSFAHWYAAAAPLVGHAFLHGGWAHLFMNAIALVQAAPTVEWRLGPWRTLVVFAVSAASGALAYILINPSSQMPAVGASGAICGLFAGFFLGVGRHWRQAFHDPPLRNGVIVFLVVNVGLAAVARLTGFLPIAWEAHLGGFIGGALAYVALAPREARGPWG